MLVKQMDDEEEFETSFFLKLCELCVKGGTMLNDMWWGRFPQDDKRDNDPRSAPSSAEKEFYDRLWLICRSFMKLNRVDRKNLMREAAEEGGIDVNYENIKSMLGATLGTDQKFNTIKYIMTKSAGEEIIKLLGGVGSSILDEKLSKLISSSGIFNVKINPENIIDKIKSENTACGGKNPNPRGCPENTKVKVGKMNGYTISKSEATRNKNAFATLQQYFPDLVNTDDVNKSIYVVVQSEGRADLPLPSSIGNNYTDSNASIFWDNIAIKDERGNGYIYVFDAGQVERTDAKAMAAMDGISEELASILN